jgi:hypothetical protein
MTARVGNWLIAIGAITIIVGLCCLPAALGEHRDPSLMGLGTSIFGMGALFVAGGLYFKAQMLRLQGNSGEAEPAPAPRTRGGCELCGSDVPVIHCRVHQLHLCSTCLAEHFDPRSCSYVPPTRRPATKSGKGMARARGV